MIYFLETVNLSMALVLCALCSISDIKEGIIHNKILIFFAVFSIIIDGIYYGIFVEDLFIDFLKNTLIVTAISLYFFFSHTLAGGDCKLVMVLSIMYPARLYFVYGTSNITLLFFFGLSFFVGYIYLFATSIKAVLNKKVVIKFEQIKHYTSGFLKSYITAMAYIALANCMYTILANAGIDFSIWIMRFVCLLIAWIVGRYSVFRNSIVFLLTILTVIVLSIITKIMPISLNPESYVIVLVLMFCQMTIRSTFYDNISISQLKPGMILSTFSSVLMQSSITKGLPSVSAEDLRNRLTLSEIDSIKKWAKATHTVELTVMRKIPFAVFISFGYLFYLLLLVIGSIIT